MDSSSFNRPEDASLDSVNDFLRKVQLAKSSSYEAVDEHLEPYMTDPATFAISPEISRLIDEEVESYGDEVLKQMSVFSLGKWLEYHQGFLQEHIANEATPEALLTMQDISTLNAALRLISEVGSFGGDEDYRKAKQKQIGQAILELIEEDGLLPEEVLNRQNDHLSFFG